MIKRILSTVVLLLVALPLAGFGVAAGMGLKRAVVLTGSMEPTYPVGSITFVDPLDPVEVAELGPGDPIMFWSPTVVPESVTHRIVEVRPEGFVTRGDANNVADGWVVPHDAVMGRVRWHVPYIGLATARLQDRTVMMTALGGVAALFVLNELVQITKAVGEGRREARDRETASRGSVRPPDVDRTALPALTGARTA